MDFRQRNRHCGGEPTRHAIFGNAFGHGHETFYLAIAGIFAKITMDVHIHQSGNHIGSLCINPFHIALGTDRVRIHKANDLFIKQECRVLHHAHGHDDAAISNCAHMDTSNDFPYKIL